MINVLRDDQKTAGSHRRGLSLLALVLLLTSQSPDALAERLPVKSYAVADGLAHDRVRRILRDSRGFLWICTIEGLSRFDGYGFVNYGVEHGLPGGNVSNMPASGRRLLDAVIRKLTGVEARKCESVNPRAAVQFVSACLGAVRSWRIEFLTE